MKSKVILFCVLLFCSKIVVSLPHAEDFVRHGAYQPPNWPVNQNAPGYHNIGFAQTHGNPLINSAHQITNTQDLYSNQGRKPYENNGYNNVPSLVPAPLNNFGPNSRSLLTRVSNVDAYPPNMNRFLPRTDNFQDGFNKQNYKNINWPTQNQQANPVSNQAIVNDQDKPSLISVQEPYHGSGPYQPINPQSNGQITYQQKENSQQPLVESINNKRFNKNKAPITPVIIPGGSYDDDETHSTSDVTRRNSGNNGYPNNIGDTREVKSTHFQFINGAPIVNQPQNTNIYDVRGSLNPRADYPVPINNNNEGPSVLKATLARDFRNGVFEDKFGLSPDAINNYNGNYGPRPNIGDNIPINNYNSNYGPRPIIGDNIPINNYNNNYGPRPIIGDNIPINNYNGNYGPSPVIGDNIPINNYNSNYGPRPDINDNVPINNYNDGSSTDTLTQVPENRDNNLLPSSNGYGDDSGSDNSPLTLVNNYNRGYFDDSGNSRNDDDGLNNPVPINTYDDGPASPTSTSTDDYGNTRNGNTDDSQNGPNKPNINSDNANPDQNIYRLLSGGVHRYDIKDIAKLPQIKNILSSNNNRRFALVHTNGTIEYVDDFETIQKYYPNYQYINNNKANSDGSTTAADNNGGYTTKAPAYQDSNLATTLGDSYWATTQGNSNLATTLVDQDGPPATKKNPWTDKNKRLSPLGGNKSNYRSSSKTRSSVVTDYTTSTTPLVPTTQIDNRSPLPTTTDSPDIITTTYYSNDNSTEGIITLSPIETATDNVSDIVPMTTVASIASTKQDTSPYTTITTLSTITDNVEDSYSTTTSPNSTAVNKNKTQSNQSAANTTVSTQTDNVKGSSYETTTYNSISHTDDPANCDGSSPTTVPSVESNVDTDDNSSTDGGNSLNSQESVTDVKLSIDTHSDNKGDTLTITIEVSDRTDDADDTSSSDDDTVLISIDTVNNSNSTQVKVTNKENGDYNNNNNQPTDDAQNTGKNFQIDLSNISDKPSIWFRTTDQNFFDKLMDNDDSQCNVIYFFQMSSQPRVDRDKTTTIYPNGTVLVETTETVYENDKPPKIIKTTKIIQG